MTKNKLVVFYFSNNSGEKMLTKICHKIAYFFVEQKIISKEDIEVYQYGFEQIISGIYTMASIIILSILFNKIIEGILFLVCFIPLRRFSGGYHANTYLKCYIYFMIIYLSIIFLMDSNIINCNIYSLIILVLSLMVLNIFSPVENENRPLESSEKIKSKKLVLTMTIIETIVLILLYLSNLHLYKTVFLALLCAAILQVIQLIKKKTAGS